MVGVRQSILRCGHLQVRSYCAFLSHIHFVHRDCTRGAPFRAPACLEMYRQGENEVSQTPGYAKNIDKLFPNLTWLLDMKLHDVCCYREEVWASLRLLLGDDHVLHSIVFQCWMASWSEGQFELLCISLPFEAGQSVAEEVRVWSWAETASLWPMFFTPDQQRVKGCASCLQNSQISYTPSKTIGKRQNRCVFGGKPMWKPQQLRWTSLQTKQTLQKRSPLHQACNQQRKHDFKPLVFLNLKSCNPFKCGTFTGNHGEPGSFEEWNLHAELALLRARMKHARRKACCVCAHKTCYVKHETCYVQAHDMSMPARALFCIWENKRLHKIKQWTKGRVLGGTLNRGTFMCNLVEPLLLTIEPLCETWWNLYF